MKTPPNVVCPYCNKPAIFTNGSQVYKRRPDLRRLHFYVCVPCDARVGTHKGTIEPLGRLANKELRKLKQNAHAAFDPYWKNGTYARKEAYRILSDKMQISEAKTHIGMFDENQCKQVVEICKDGL